MSPAGLFTVIAGVDFQCPDGFFSHCLFRENENLQIYLDSDTC
jgi:hypothetical protein